LASQHYVRVTIEGDQSLFFDGDPSIIATGKKKSKSKSKEEHEGPDFLWRDSDAKKLLYKDLRRDKVPAKAKDQHNKSTMELKNIYVMRPEYSEYCYDMFSSRLSSLRSTFFTNTHRAEDDQAAFDVNGKVRLIATFFECIAEVHSKPKVL
jgi:hypothetical protein